MEYYASIDLSMRSTGVVILDKEGNLIDYTLVSNIEDNESLIIKNASHIINFLQKHERYLKKITLEGLAFLAISGMKDVIYGNFWYLRCTLMLTFPSIYVTIVPVTQWRKDVISKERAKELKITKDKAWAKKECVAKLPIEVSDKFREYILSNKFKKDSIYDLTDAYHLCMFSLKER